jgi:3-hydroxyisobutyrate dehydrogenase
MAVVAFIGLGAMGFPMAGHLVRAGHVVRVHNRTAAVAERWLATHGVVGLPGDMAPPTSDPTSDPAGATGAAGGPPRDGARAAATLAGNPAVAAAGADVVCICVGADDDVRAVVLGPGGALAAMAPRGVLVDHTTASPGLARELATAAAARGIGFVDAPVSGGQSGAESGQLSVMCGGDARHVDAVRPVLAAYAKAITHVGPAGHGQLTKMVNQILCAAAIQGAAEALAFGLRAGLDMPAVLDAVTSGAANSWYLEHRGATMLEDRFDFGFAVDWMRKDLRLCLDEAADVGADLPTAALVEGEMAALQARGASRLDATSLIRLFRHDLG